MEDNALFKSHRLVNKTLSVGRRLFPYELLCREWVVGRAPPPNDIGSSRPIRTL